MNGTDISIRIFLPVQDGILGSAGIIQSEDPNGLNGDRATVHEQLDAGNET